MWKQKSEKLLFVPFLKMTVWGELVRVRVCLVAIFLCAYLIDHACSQMMQQIQQPGQGQPMQQQPMQMERQGQGQPMMIIQQPPQGVGDGKIGGGESPKLSSAERAAILAATPQHFDPIPGVIMPDTTGNSNCVPSYSCDGINIKEVPYVFEHVLAKFVNQRVNNLFDSKKTQSCLANKRILVLGDSVL